MIKEFKEFILVKSYNKAKDSFDKEDETPEEEPEPTAEEKLLTEIRDILAKGNG